MRVSIRRRPLRKRRGPRRRSRQVCRTTDSALRPQPPGQDLPALRPMPGDRNGDAGDRVSGSTPNSDRAGAGAATAWPDVRAPTDGARQRRDSTAADTSTGAAANPAATGAGQPGVNGSATGNSPSGSGGDFGIKRFGGAEGGDFPSRNAGIGFKSADSAWYAALEEMKDLGAQYYPEEAKSRGFIPELGVEIHERGGLYYYDRIARGFKHGALGGGVGFGDSGAVARGHMHWDSQLESKPDLKNAEAYSQAVPGYQAWVGSWDGFKLYWHNGKPTEPGMPDWNRHKY
jgi:hypothetical protein